MDGDPTFRSWANTVFPVNQGGNSTVATSPMTCLYPLSGQYGLLARLLFYCTLLVTIFLHHWIWLVAGAAASAMTFSGAAAVHAIILVAGPRGQTSPFDLDIAGAYAIASTGLVMVIPILTFSRTLTRTSVRHLFRLWGVLMLVGAACAMAAMWRLWPEEPPCITSAGKTLTSPLQLDVADFNCTYVCFGGVGSGSGSGNASSSAGTDVVRGASDVLAFPLTEANGSLRLFLFICALVVSLVSVCNLLYFAWNRRNKDTLYQSAQARHQRHVVGGDGTPSMNQQQPPTKRVSGCWACLGIVPVLISPFLLVLNVVCVELFFANGGVPVSEEPNLVGQWSVMLGAGLVIIGAAVDRWFEKKEKNKETEGEEGQGQGNNGAGNNQEPQGYIDRSNGHRPMFFFRKQEPTVTMTETEMAMASPDGNSVRSGAADGNLFYSNRV